METKPKTKATLETVLVRLRIPGQNLDSSLNLRESRRLQGAIVEVIA
jgi:hypothetical protein